MRVESEPREPARYRFKIHPSYTAIPHELSRRETPDFVVPTMKQNEHVDAKHFRKGKRSIEWTANQARRQIPTGEKKKALILGPGSCDDIPLEHLADSFDELTLVELRAEVTQQVVEARIPRDKQHKITIVQADITNRAAEILTGMDEAEKTKGESPIHFMAAVGRLYKQAQNQSHKIDVGSGYHYVNSHLVMSQLINIWSRYLDGYFKNIGMTDPEQFPGYRDSSTITEEIKLKEQIERDHLTMLYEAVSPTGLVHFADTSYDGGQAMQSLSAEHFTSRPVDKWKWPRPDAGMWDVTVFALTPQPK